MMQWIFREQKLRSVLAMAADRTIKDIQTRTVQGSAAPSAKYDILVSVFNPRPDQQTVKWNVRAAIESKLYHFAVTAKFSNQ